MKWLVCALLTLNPFAQSLVADGLVRPPQNYKGSLAESAQEAIIVFTAGTEAESAPGGFDSQDPGRRGGEQLCLDRTASGCPGNRKGGCRAVPGMFRLRAGPSGPEAQGNPGAKVGQSGRRRIRPGFRGGDSPGGRRQLRRRRGPGKRGRIPEHLARRQRLPSHRGRGKKSSGSTATRDMSSPASRSARWPWIREPPTSTRCASPSRPAGGTGFTSPCASPDCRRSRSTSTSTCSTGPGSTTTSISSDTNTAVSISTIATGTPGNAKPTPEKPGRSPKTIPTSATSASRIPKLKKFFQARYPGERFYLTNLVARDLDPETIRDWTDDLWMYPYYTKKDFVPYDAR